ncbi:YncE family protein [Sphingobacterium faecale]|uniref:YncE family protein n=1 Tax=Sphingobacterium faecale TaxID=2803775 RepID=A0ABS1R8J1_9SPHI|nr:YncE family protein [Sphingobacterium faecale]MBL1411034.1 YncE family protein [Sphingobacterium faecale]
MKQILLGAAITFASVLAYGQENTANFKIEQAQKLPNELYQLVYNPTTQLVYVAGPQKGFNKETENFVYVLDGQSLALRDSISLGKYLPFGIALNNQTQTLYVGHSLQNAVSAIDLKSKEQHVISNGKEKSKIREIAVDEIRNKVYVSDHGNPSIWEIDGKSNTYLGSFEKAGAYLLGLNVDPQRGKVYGTDANTMEGNILVYNSDSRALEGQFKTWSYCPLNIALDKKENRLFVSQSNDNNITIVDGNTGDILQKVYLGYDSSPIGLVYDENSKLLYTANRNKQEVAIIDTDTYKVVERIATKGLPNTITLDPVSGAVYVTNKQAGKKGEPVENANTVLKINRI